MGLAFSNRQVFTASGTWHKVAGVKAIRVQLVSGGGGAGSGRRGAAGLTRGGGGGGAGGSYIEAWYMAADLPSTVAVTVGAGGLGGAAVLIDDTSGNDGVTGGATDFGTYLRAMTQLTTGRGGPLGAGTQGTPYLPYSAGGPGTAAGSGNPSFGGGGGFIWPGGGAGGGILVTPDTVGSLNDPSNNIGMNDPNVQASGTPGHPNATPVASPKSLTDVAFAFIPWYAGAGGIAATGGTAGNGGDGQGYGAGGGGGGAVVNGFASGAGGTGANGIAIVTSYT